MDITDNVEGTEIPADHCAWCQEPLEVGDTVTMYASDTDHNPKAPHEDFGIERVYGADCCRRLEIDLPSVNAVEALFAAQIDPSWEAYDVHLIDKSTTGEGIEWSPPSMITLVTGMEFETFMDDPSLDHVRLSPGMIYDLILGWDIDPKSIIDEDGKVVMSEDEIRQMQADLQERIDRQYEEMET